MTRIYTAVKKSGDAPDLATALGDMLFAWTWAERMQTSAMATMLGVPHYKASRLYQKLPNYRSRTQALYMLIELHPEFEALKQPIAKLSNLSKARNNWVHGSFIKDADEVRVINLDEGLDSDSRSKPIKAADILNHSLAVRTRAGELHDELRKLPEYRAWSEARTLERTKALGLQESQ